MVALPEVMVPRFETTVPTLKAGKIRGRSFSGAYRVLEASVRFSRTLCERTIAGGLDLLASESSGERSDEDLFLAQLRKRAPLVLLRRRREPNEIGEQDGGESSVPGHTSGSGSNRSPCGRHLRRARDSWFTARAPVGAAAVDPLPGL